MLLRKIFTLYYFLKHIFELICNNLHHIPPFITMVAQAITFRYIWICLSIAFRIKLRYFLILGFVLRGKTYTLSTIRHALKTNRRFYKYVIDKAFIRIKGYRVTIMLRILNMSYKATGVLYFMLSLFAGVIYIIILITLNNNKGLEIYNILNTINVFILIFFSLLPAFLGIMSYFFMPLLSNTAVETSSKIRNLNLSLLLASFVCFIYSTYSIGVYFTMPLELHNLKSIIIFLLLSLIINSINSLIYFINIIRISFNRNSNLKYKHIFKFIFFLLFLIFFLLCSFLIFLVITFWIIKDFEINIVEEELKNILKYNAIIILIIFIFMLIFDIISIFYFKSLKLCILFIFFIICSCYMSNYFNIIIIVWLFVIYYNYSDILKYIILFILSLAFVFFLIMYGINNENKVLYYILLIFSMIVSHYWTYEIIPRVCNISKNRLYVCDMIIILLGCFFIIHTIFLDFSLGKSYTEFITLYGSFIIYYKIINLIISIIPKNLTKKYLIIFPWTRRQKLYEGMEDVQKIYMYDWFLGLEVLEEMMPFYEEMADLQEDDLEFDPVDYYFYPVNNEDLDEEIGDDANWDIIIATIEYYDEAIRAREERYWDMKWLSRSEGYFNILNEYETDLEE